MPDILKPLEYDVALEMAIERVRRVYPNYIQLESDVFSVILEAFAYMLVHQDQKRVNSIKALLLQFSEGVELDVLCQLYGVERLEGAYPYADHTFSLSAPLKSDVIIPRALELGDDSGEHRAYLRENLLIKAGETSAVGVVEYSQKIPYAEVKCENVLTSLVFSLKASANGIFENGGEVESDAAFRARAILSLHSHTSAGSNKSYQYHAKSADSRIDDVAVFTEPTTPGIVDVYLKSEGGVDELMIERVKSALNKEYVRPLTDFVRVFAVSDKEITLEADVYLFNLQDAKGVREIYAKRFEERIFRIGEDLPLSEIVRDMHCEGVYKVELKNPTSDVTPIDKKEVIKIIGLDITFKEAPFEELSIKAKQC